MLIRRAQLYRDYAPNAQSIVIDRTSSPQWWRLPDVPCRNRRGPTEPSTTACAHSAARKNTNHARWRFAVSLAVKDQNRGNSCNRVTSETSRRIETHVRPNLRDVKRNLSE